MQQIVAVSLQAAAGGRSLEIVRGTAAGIGEWPHERGGADRAADDFASLGTELLLDQVLNARGQLHAFQEGKLELRIANDFFDFGAASRRDRIRGQLFL